MLCTLLALALPALTIDNFRDGAEVRYPLVMLRGAATGASMKANGTEFPVVEGRYIALVELKPGKNDVKVEASGLSTKLRLTFKQPTTEYKVQPVWLTTKDGDGRYYTTFPDRDQKMPEKVDLAFKLMQCFTAEAMNDMGYGRKTFALDLDGKGRVKIADVRLDKTTAELRPMTDNDIWGYVYGTLTKKYGEGKTKWAALLSATSYDSVTKKLLNHFALGGGSLACFGAGSMDFWPSRMQDLNRVFNDATPIDPQKRFEDSAYRATVWANVATAYGAFLHELGHTFGLPHTADRFCIMSRGFDHFNRVFSLTEPGFQYHPEPTKFLPTEVAYWEPHFAARLNWSRWFQPDKRSYEGKPVTVRLDGNEVVFEAEAGLRVIGAEADNVPAVWRQFLQEDPPKSTRWSTSDLEDRMHAKQFRITAVDSNGNQATVDYKSLN